MHPRVHKTPFTLSPERAAGAEKSHRVTFEKPCKAATIVVHFVQDELLLPGYNRTVEGSQYKESTMRKVISFLHVSLDGFTTGPNGEFDGPA